MSKIITQKQLKNILDYNPETGLFVWLVSSGSAKAGDLAGSPDINNLGNIRLNYKKKKYAISHLAWLYMYGEFPTNLVDHINGNSQDNRITNLREADYQKNNMNKAIGKNNTSGVMGVAWFKAGNKWKAYISLDGKKIHLGYFHKFSEAVDVRKLAEVAYGFHKNHGRTKRCLLEK